MYDIPFHKPYVGPEEENAVLQVLRSGWLTTGKEALAFESEFAEFLNQFSMSKPTLYCMAVNSATSGLHLALEALGVGPGDAVFVPSYTFTASAEVIRYLGAEAVFVDIAPDSYNIDTDMLEEAITKTKAFKPKAIMAIHFGGLPCDMQQINRIAQKYSLSVVEDAAHAFPARRADGTWAGTCGDAGVFSFYANKTLCTGEGGMVVTRREDIARRVSLMRNHGIDRAVWNRFTDTAAPWYYEVTAPGFKYNMPDILAALGRVQLRRAMDLLQMRIDIAERYDKAFAGNANLTTPAQGGARHLYCLRLKDPSKRDSFIESLRKEGIGTSVHYIPLHIMPYYRERYKLNPQDYPESYRRFLEAVSLPIWPGMSGEQVERVISAVVKCLAPNP